MTTNETFRVSPEHIGSQLLLKLKRMAEDHLGVPILKAVISVPAEFDERQRNATVKAANLAGVVFLFQNCSVEPYIIFISLLVKSREDRKP